jgi:hypothetical protein
MIRPFSNKTLNKFLSDHYKKGQHTLVPAFSNRYEAVKLRYGLMVMDSRASA